MTSAEPAVSDRESFLIADCGCTNTTVSLFDVAVGTYRLIACATVPTSTRPPDADITTGIQLAIDRITEATGRELLTERGMLIQPSRQNGSGVDKLIVVISAASPLSTLLVGLFDDVSIASARRAMATGYLAEVDHMSPKDTRSEKQQIKAMVDNLPDLIFMVGGTDGGAEQQLIELLETVSLGAGAMAERKRPHVLFAGNINLREKVRHALAENARVHVTDNVRPDLRTEHLNHAHQAATQLYEMVKIDSLPGVRKLRTWNPISIQPTAEAFTAVARYFAALQKNRVLGVDLGSASATLVAADQEKAYVSLRSDLGMGRPISNLLTEDDIEEMVRWMPSEVSTRELVDFVQNKSIHPHSTPMTEKELQFEHAAARAIVKRAAADAYYSWGWTPDAVPNFSMILARGGVLARAPRPGQVALMLLDALQPKGLFSIALDRNGVLPALGALAAHDPLAVVQAFEGGVIEPLGWAVVPRGKGKPGQKILRVIMESAQIRRLEIEVDYGTLEVLPLPPGHSAEVILEPERRVDVGFGPGKSQKVILQGGTIGLIVDARGRPVAHPADEAARREKVNQWLWALGG